MSSDTNKKVEAEDDRHSDSNIHTTSSSGSTSDTANGDPPVPPMSSEKAERVDSTLKQDPLDADIASSEDDSVERHPEVHSTDSEVESGDDSEGDGVEDDEDEDEDSEPALKYALLGGATNVILHKDAASALAVSKKHIVSGSWLQSVQASSHHL